MNGELSTQVPFTEHRIGFGRRLGALLLDAFAAMIIAGLAYLLFGSELTPIAENVIEKQMSELSPTLEDSMEFGSVSQFVTTMTVFGFIVTIVGLVYWLSEIILAASPGKLALKIMIANPDGTPAARSTLALRWLIKSGIALLLTALYYITGIGLFNTLNTIVGFVILVGCFLVLGSNRQALHDMIAKTAVYPRDVVQNAHAAS